MRRVSQGWQRIGWDEAFEEVARNLKRINATYGKSSIATYLGNPTVHSYSAMLFAPGFIRSLHTRNRFSATSVDQLAHHLPLTSCLVINCCCRFGRRPHAVSADPWRESRGVERQSDDGSGDESQVAGDSPARRSSLLVDPRYNETARLADRHLFIRPGTDVLLLLALLHVLFGKTGAAGATGGVY